HAQPAHIGVLGRRYVEQPIELPAEGIGGLWIFVVGGLLLEPAIGIERMLLALELLLFGELAPGFDEAVLRAQVLGVRTGGLGRRWCAAKAARVARNSETGCEAFE